MNRSELIHDTAIHTNIFVLCSLTYLCQSHLVNLVVGDIDFQWGGSDIPLDITGYGCGIDDCLFAIFGIEFLFR